MSEKNIQNHDLSSEDNQRLAELGRLSASLLHEISNPLSVALLHLDQVGDQSSHNIKHIRRSLNRLTRYVNAARGQITNDIGSRSFLVNGQIREVKRLVIPVARASYVKLKVSKPPHLKLKGDALQFQQILVNLIINAIEAYPTTDHIDKSRLVSVEFSYTKNFLTIKVSDRGSGIIVTQLARVFDPFYTTKSSSGHGLGLGLVIVKSYVEKGFNGNISVKSSAKQGTSFSIKLPHL
jgi:signal transduction histidine kinase